MISHHDTEWYYCLQEMLITPVLLQFLEQALEPIPMPPLTHIKTPTNECKIPYLMIYFL